MARFRAGAILCLIALVAWAGTASAADCNGAQAAAWHLRIRQAEAKLDAAANAGMNGSAQVPASVESDVQAFKDALVDVADHRMACQTSAAPEAQAIEAQLAGALGANKPAETQARDASAAGLIVRVREAWGMPEWLLARIGFPLGACCIADDNLLLVYAYSKGRWRRVLRLQSGAYTDVGGAWGDFFDYLVLPAEVGRARRIVIAHGKPWPQSCWSGFVIDVFEPQTSRDSAQRVFHADHGYRRCGMRPELTRTANGFGLAANLGTWRMPSVLRDGLFRYHPQGHGYVRVQPVAFNPRDFVGAWLDAKWAEASQWSSPATNAALHKVHSDLEHGRDFDWVEYGDVDACPHDNFQVALDLEFILLDKVLSKRTLRFMVHADGGDVFTLLGASATSDPACDRKLAMQRD